MVLGEWGSEIIGVMLKGPTPTMRSREWNVVLRDLAPASVKGGPWVEGGIRDVIMKDLPPAFAPHARVDGMWFCKT